MSHDPESTWAPTPIRRAVNWALGFFNREIALGHYGICGSKMLEPHYEFVRADNEHVINDTNGSYIVLGRDRPGDRCSGYGSEHCSSRVDIVVGRLLMDGPPKAGSTPGPGPTHAVNENNEILWSDPSFEKDAARIYISARANIDDYFNLREGKVGMSRARSAVGIKADAVRIIGREGIKLVTRPEPLNSMGGKIERVRGIDLIAGNDDRDLQPLVKGRNLINAISSLIAHIGRLNGLVDGILSQQMYLNQAICNHTHPIVIDPVTGTLETTQSLEINVFPGGVEPPTLPPGGFTDVELDALERLPSLPPGPAAAFGHFQNSIDLKRTRMNGEFLNSNFLKPFGREYICSRYNNVN